MGELFGSHQYYDKQKLTIGLSKEVIDRAKAARINISALTEIALKGLTYEPAGYSNDDVADAYDKLFKLMLPVLDKYGASVTVGEHTNYILLDKGPYPCDIILDKSGKLWIYSDIYEDEYPSISIADALNYLYDPPRILEALVKSLITAAERNKDKLQTFKFASRFLKMLSEDEEHPTSAKEENSVFNKRIFFTHDTIENTDTTQSVVDR